MLEQLLPAVRITLVLTVLTGVLYPALVTGIAQSIFPKQANGSLIEVNGNVIGSELIGQKFSKPEYFQGRPSSAGDGYDAANSGAFNFGPTNQKLVDRIKADAEVFGISLSYKKRPILHDKGLAIGAVSPRKVIR